MNPKFLTALFSLAVLATTVTSASAATYTARATAKKPWQWMIDPLGKPYFSDLEQGGVRTAAQDGAVQACRQAGASGCTPTGSTITACNFDIPNGEAGAAGTSYIGCQADASAEGY